MKGIKDDYGYAVDIDLSKFFDNVDHDLLMNRLGKWVADKQLLALIGKYLRAEVSIEEETRANLSVNVPAQDWSALSPLSLPTLCWTAVDRIFRRCIRVHYRLCTCTSDDFVISVLYPSTEGERVKAEDSPLFWKHLSCLSTQRKAKWSKDSKQLCKSWLLPLEA